MVSWRSIPSFDGRYSASSDGLIRSEKRHQIRGDRTYTIRQRILLDCDDGHGYRHLLLGRGNWRWVHRLVAEAFIGPCPTGREINHKDGDKTNNRVDNLEYVTTQENLAHARRLGLIDNRGELNHFARLSSEDVISIRNSPAHLDYPTLAAMYDVHSATIRRIMRRKTWKHL